MDEKVKRRRYTSPKRQRQAQATRRAILDAAHRLFLAKGYVETSIREIAAEAGVAEPTVYAIFKDKAAVLWAVGDRILSGGEDPIPLAESDTVRTIKAEPNVRQRLRMIVRSSREIKERGMGDMEDVVWRAAAADLRLEGLVRKALEKRRQDYQMRVELLLEVGQLRPGISTDDAVDLFEAIGSTAVYRLLVNERGWSPEKWEHWMVEIVERLFLELDDSRGNGLAKR